MEYAMKSKGAQARLDERYSRRLVEVSNRRYIPGGVVVDVRLLELEGWTCGLTSWVEPECNIEYVKEVQ